MNDVKFSINSYTMNRLTVAAGTAALEDEEYFKETCDKVIATRERTKVRLRELGFDMPDSKSNFVFVTHESIPASDIFNAAKSAGIYLRWWNKDRISNRLRISIGTDEEMDALFAFLKEYIEARG